MIDEKETIKKIKVFKKKIKKEILAISALRQTGIKKIKENLFTNVH